MQQLSRRKDIDAFIREGLGPCMTEKLAGVGRVDSHDDEDVRQLAAAVRALLSICRAHPLHEDDHLHRALQARRPGPVAQAPAEHAEHKAAFERIEALLQWLEAAQ